MALEMNLDDYKKIFLNTVNNYTRSAKKQIINELENEKIISFDPNIKIGEDGNALYISSKDFDEIIYRILIENNNVYFFEFWEFVKMYKYYIPLYFEGEINSQLTNITEFSLSDKTELPRALASNLLEIQPYLYKENSLYFLKFCMQRNYYDAQKAEVVDYRYVINIVLDVENKMIDIRFDGLKSEPNVDTTRFFSDIYKMCISWLKENLGIKIYSVETKRTIDVIKNDTSNVKIYKQMMCLSSGGSAELTASGVNNDYVLPFIDELKELIEENDEINKSEVIKNILLEYIKDKEETSIYPYIYVKWNRPIESQSFIVKVVFRYNNEYTQLQHIAGQCKSARMERMNETIKYLFNSGAFIKGEELQ